MGVRRTGGYEAVVNLGVLLVALCCHAHASFVSLPQVADPTPPYQPDRKGAPSSSVGGRGYP